MKQTICKNSVTSLYCTIAIKIAFLPIISQNDQDSFLATSIIPHALVHHF